MNHLGTDEMVAISDCVVNGLKHTVIIKVIHPLHHFYYFLLELVVSLHYVEGL